MDRTRRLDRPRRGRLTHFFGGSPIGVLTRLVILSFVVGLVLSVLDIHPVELIQWVRSRFDYIVSLGFETVEKAGRYFLLGAVIVFPIWLVVRIVKVASRGAWR